MVSVEARIETRAGADVGLVIASETGVVSQIGSNCTLHLAQGAIEPCSGDRCAFWEPGGAVASDGCLIERLGLELRRSDLAAYLIETRERLERARDLSEAEAAHRDFSRRIGLEL